MRAAALLLLAINALAIDLGGHIAPLESAKDSSSSTDQRKATLEELWQRRLLPPDQRMWAPRDYDLLEKIRKVDHDASDYLKRRFGDNSRWVAQPRHTQMKSRPRLTREGYEKYLNAKTQDAIGYFESKGVDAKWVFQLRDLNEQLLFDAGGRITDVGLEVYRRAELNLEAFWKTPDGEVFGTRRQPSPRPAQKIKKS